MTISQFPDYYQISIPESKIQKWILHKILQILAFLFKHKGNSIQSVNALIECGFEPKFAKKIDRPRRIVDLTWCTPLRK